MPRRQSWLQNIGDNATEIAAKNTAECFDSARKDALSLGTMCRIDAARDTSRPPMSFAISHKSLPFSKDRVPQRMPANKERSGRAKHQWGNGWLRTLYLLCDGGPRRGAPLIRGFRMSGFG
jgi:hypothetical protein